jgi:hypothetical protein
MGTEILMGLGWMISWFLVWVVKFWIVFSEETEWEWCVLWVMEFLEDFSLKKTEWMGEKIFLGRNGVDNPLGMVTLRLILKYKF